MINVVIFCPVSKGYLSFVGREGFRWPQWGGGGGKGIDPIIRSYLKFQVVTFEENSIGRFDNGNSAMLNFSMYTQQIPDQVGSGLRNHKGPEP